MPETLTDAERRVLRAVASRRRALASRAALGRQGHEPATIDGLIAAGWLAAWAEPHNAGRLAEWKAEGGPDAVTLTPWGAERLAVELVEHWESVSVPAVRERIKLRKRAGKTVRVRVEVAVRVRVPTEVPAWSDRPDAGPVRLPRFGVEGHAPPWVFAELADASVGADPAEAAILAELAVRGPDGVLYAKDPATGEAMILFPDSLGGGWPVRFEATG